MRLSTAAIGLLSALPTAVQCWGSLGHISVAYISTNFVQDETARYFKGLLRNDTNDYLAGVATWADSIRYTKWGRFTAGFHYIDAHDEPPTYCGVDFDRDCKKDGCIISALQNYTNQLLDGNLVAWRRMQAAKFVIHFVGDIHQPLHTENVLQGGNGIHVKWEDADLNLHHVWDSSIAEKMLGGIHRKPYPAALEWAANLSTEIRTETSMKWASESNTHVCESVLPQGASAIVGQELAFGEYYETAVPVIELQVAKAGYRLAKWLDLIAERISFQALDEL
ncbi:rRNA-processing protein las1 [Apiospora arundinis]